jgi:protein SCO1
MAFRKRPGATTWLLALMIMAAVVGGIASFAISSAQTAKPASTSSIGGPFTLTTQTGARLSEADLKGKPYAIFFGFTHCPEVCPTTLFEMSEALKELGPKAEDLRVLFVSVDPERDRPEFMARYLQSFDPRIVGLTGTPAEVETAAKAYHVFWEKVPTEDGDYTMNHTASVFLMDAAGQFQGVIAYGEAAKTRLQKLQRLVSEPASTASVQPAPSA